MPREPSMPICPPEQNECVHEAREFIEETAFDAEANSECQCLPGCTNIEYPIETSQSRIGKAAFLDLPKNITGMQDIIFPSDIPMCA